jgi:3-phenylpropionate/cinnamic acid dioxygenase small subunit
MTLSLQEISDRIEIQELLTKYSHCVDTRNWDDWEDVFTPDAIIDYTEMGGSRGTVAETRLFLETAMPNFSGFQHMISNFMLEFVDADTVKGRTMCHNPMVMDTGDGNTHVFFCGLWYRDLIVRTPDGWRIKDRHEEKSYFHNVPQGFAPPAEG